MNMHIKPTVLPAASLWPVVKRRLRAARGTLIVTLLIGSLAALAYSLALLYSLNRQNAQITALASGEDVGANASAGEVQLARAALLASRDRFDDAQAIVDAAKPTATPHTLSRMLYNQANTNVRRAFAAIEAGKADAAVPLTKLAKDAYREALRLDPASWNAKHNYDVAARLMRDFPGHEQDGEEVPPESDVKLWTDLPGVPQGAP
jgi:mxaK protein